MPLKIEADGVREYGGRSFSWAQLPWLFGMPGFLLWLVRWAFRLSHPWPGSIHGAGLGPCHATLAALVDPKRARSRSIWAANHTAKSELTRR